jgi:hypothetical protein
MFDVVVKLFDPFCEEAPRPPELFEVLAAAFSEYTLRGGPFSDGTFSTSTRPRCSILTSRA